MRYFANRTSKDASTVATEAIVKLDNDWADREGRMAVVPGKQFLSTLNGHLQHDFGVSITAPQIIRHLTPEMIAGDLREILSDVNRFAR